MSIEQMRKAIFDAYHSIPWQDKVKKMPEPQVIAVYNRLRDQKRI